MNLMASARTVKPHDARAVANLLLQRATVRGMKMSNLALQKLLYFAHGAYLIRTGRPLVSGYFEAWRYGPVHPLVYETFKDQGARAITKTATRTDWSTGQEVALDRVVDQDAADAIDQILTSLGRLPVGRLIDLSHAPKGPWAHVVNEARTRGGLGIRISDSVTIERFRFLKGTVSTESRLGDPVEDTPLT